MVDDICAHNRHLGMNDRGPQVARRETKSEEVPKSVENSGEDLLGVRLVGNTQHRRGRQEEIWCCRKYS